jgi:hypothetical protein
MCTWEFRVQPSNLICLESSGPVLGLPKEARVRVVKDMNKLTLNLKYPSHPPATSSKSKKKALRGIATRERRL